MNYRDEGEYDLEGWIVPEELEPHKKRKQEEFRSKYPNIGNEPYRCASCLEMPPCGCGQYVSMEWAYPMNYE